jgi:PilZ domain
MLSEKRRNFRKAIARQVWVDLEDGKPAIGCMLGNLSDTGANVILPSGQELPHEFVLRLSADGRVARRCRIAWKTATEAGVAFTARLVAAGGDKDGR